MADYRKQQKTNDAYNKLRADIKAGTLAPLYALYGEERYLLEFCLGQMRNTVEKGTEEFNYKRLDGKTLTWQDLQEAVDSVPMFSDRIFIEIQDYEFNKMGDEARKEFIRILSDIPEYTTVAFVFPGDEFKLDSRVKANAALKELFSPVEFITQEGSDLVKWVVRHAKDAGKAIDKPTAEYLIFVTGGLMTSMTGEIEKLAAYAKGESITKADIDAIVTPTVEAVIWDLTDAIADGNSGLAAKKMGELLQNNENANGIIYVISQKMRQLLSTRAILDDGGTMNEIISALQIKEYPAKKLVGSARKLSLKRWRKNMNYCVEAAYMLNSNYRREKEILAELIARIGA